MVAFHDVFVGSVERRRLWMSSGLVSRMVARLIYTVRRGHGLVFSVLVFAMLFSVMYSAHRGGIAINASLHCSGNHKTLDSLLGEPSQQIVAKHLLDASA